MDLEDKGATGGARRGPEHADQTPPQGGQGMGGGLFVLLGLLQDVVLPAGREPRPVPTKEVSVMRARHMRQTTHAPIYPPDRQYPSPGTYNIFWKMWVRFQKTPKVLQFVVDVLPPKVLQFVDVLHRFEANLHGTVKCEVDVLQRIRLQRVVDIKPGSICDRG